MWAERWKPLFWSKSTPLKKTWWTQSVLTDPSTLTSVYSTEHRMCHKLIPTPSFPECKTMILLITRCYDVFKSPLSVVQRLRHFFPKPLSILNYTENFFSLPWNLFLFSYSFRKFRPLSHTYSPPKFICTIRTPYCSYSQTFLVVHIYSFISSSNLFTKTRSNIV